MQSGQGQLFNSQVEQTAQSSDSRSPNSQDINASNNQLSDSDKTYIGSWVISDCRYIGNMAQASFLYQTHADIDYTISNEIDQEIQYSTLVGSGVGLLTGFVLHFALKNRYKKLTSTNPFYRTIDTLANVGSAVGETLGYLDLPFIPKGAQRIFSLLLADAIGFTAALLVFPYWLIREKVLNIPATEKNTYTKTGSEGWSRYGKTGVVLGRNAGQLIGFGMSPHDQSFATTRTIGFYGATGAIGGFATSMIAVPIINKFFNGKLIADTQCTINILSETDFKLRDTALDKKNTYYLFCANGRWQMRFINHKGEICVIDINDINQLNETLNRLPNKSQASAEQLNAINDLINPYHARYVKGLFRNNYIRAGMTFGMALGTVIGFFAGLLIPGLGPFIGASVVGAISSIIFGGYYGATGHELNATIHKNKDLDNSWDYTTRSTATLFAAVGTLIGLLIPLPGAALVGAAIGGAIGWQLGLKLPVFARKLQPKEEKTTTISWTNRQDMGSNIGAFVGGVIGLAAGLLGGPLGMFVGISVGMAAGTIIGGMIGILYEKCARKQVIRGIKDIFGMEQTAEPDLTLNTTSNTPTTPAVAVTLNASSNTPTPTVTPATSPTSTSSTGTMLQLIEQAPPQRPSLDSPSSTSSTEKSDKPKPTNPLFTKLSPTEATTPPSPTHLTKRAI